MASKKPATIREVQKNKGGRPRQLPAVQVNITMSADLKRQLEEVAAQQVLTVSEYVRLRIFGNTETRTASPQFWDTGQHPEFKPKSLDELHRLRSIRGEVFSDWFNRVTAEFYERMHAQGLDPITGKPKLSEATQSEE